MNTIQDWNIDLTEYETATWGSASKKFKVPASIIKRYNDFATTQDVTDAFNNIAIIVMSSIIKFKPVLRKLKFKWLKPQTKEQLRYAVYAGIQHLSMNNNIWERTNASSISTPNFNMNADTPSYLLNTDIFSKYMIPFIQNSNIDLYTVYEEDEFYKTNQNGSIEIIGKFDAAKIPELI